MVLGGGLMPASWGGGGGNRGDVWDADWQLGLRHSLDFQCSPVPHPADTDLLEVAFGKLNPVLPTQTLFLGSDPCLLLWR